RLLVDHLGDADSAKDLHRALRDLGRPGVYRRAAVMLYGKRGHALMAEKKRRRHADEAATDDQNGNVVIGHDEISLVSVATVLCGAALRRRGHRVLLRPVRVVHDPTLEV